MDFVKSEVDFPTKIVRLNSEADRLEEISKHSFFHHYKDLNFRCGDNTNVSVNKLLMVGNSKLLKNIYSEKEFQILNLFTTQDIICPDFDSDALRQIINLLYHGETRKRLVPGYSSAHFFSILAFSKSKSFVFEEILSLSL